MLFWLIACEKLTKDSMDILGIYQPIFDAGPILVKELFSRKYNSCLFLESFDILEKNYTLKCYTFIIISYYLLLLSFKL